MGGMLAFDALVSYVSLACPSKCVRLHFEAANSTDVWRYVSRGGLPFLYITIHKELDTLNLHCFNDRETFCVPFKRGFKYKLFPFLLVSKRLRLSQSRMKDYGIVI